MQPPYHEPVIQGKPSKKNKAFGRIIKSMALGSLILSILFIMMGLLLPQTLHGASKPIYGISVASSEALEVQKGEILVIDYSVEGKDAAFYLTYGAPWSTENQDYIVKMDHAGLDHFEVEAEKTGFYFMNFQSNDPSSHGTFNVDLEYKVISRFTPTYIILGITALIVGLGLALFYMGWKKKPHMLEDEYIRI
jgi:hypothetical protein